MKVYEKVLQYLSLNGVREIWGVPSATFSPIVDALIDFKDIEYIRTFHEGAASFSADKYGKIGEKIGVCVLSGSVGLANAINGIAEARQYKSPVLVIGGQINTWQKGLGAIQELPGDKLVGGLVKYTVEINNEKNVIKELKKAMEIALEHPRGPVHVEIPLDIQKSEYTGEEYGIFNVRSIMPDYTALDEAVELINKCSNGLIIVGGGCRGLRDKILYLEEKLNWRMVTTTGGKSVIEETYRLNMGNFGFPGTDLANKIVLNDDNIECVLALGTQLGENATQNFDKRLTSGRKLIHIDIDNEAFNKAYKADVAVISDLGEALDYLTEHIMYKYMDNDISEPLNEPYEDSHTGVSLRRFYENITNILPKDTFYLNDIGSSQNFAYKFLKVPKEGDFECNISHGSMGSSSGAMGISRLFSNRTVAVVVGDGSFFMSNLNELRTHKRYNMNIITFVVNNSGLEFVRKGHDVIHSRHPEIMEDEKIDITKMVSGMGIKAIKINTDLELFKLKDLDLNNEPLVVELMVNCSEPMPLGRLALLIKN